MLRIDRSRPSQRCYGSRPQSPLRVYTRKDGKGTPERGQGVGARSSINTTSSARVEARRESPGSPMESLDTYAAANLLSMRPGANAGINRSGNSNLAPDCGLASMRPGANRRDHV